MNKNKENEIRRLLDLYYEGRTSREEERRLSELLHTEHSLPEDLQRERELFAMLSADSVAEMPPEADDRLLSAIDDEISRSQRPLRNRRLWMVAASVAACLLLVALFLALFIKNGPEQPLTPKYVKVESRTEMHPDTAVTIMSISDNEGRVLQKKVETPRRQKTQESAVAGVVDKKSSRVSTLDKTRHDDDTYFLTAEEERILESGNYRVVNDEREAYAIVNSVFSRMDGTLTESTHRIDDINMEYERALRDASFEDTGF